MDKEKRGIGMIFLVSLAVSVGWSIAGIVLNIASAVIMIISVLSFMIMFIVGAYNGHVSKQLTAMDYKLTGMSESITELNKKIK